MSQGGGRKELSNCHSRKKRPGFEAGENSWDRTKSDLGSQMPHHNQHYNTMRSPHPHHWSFNHRPNDIHPPYNHFNGHRPMHPSHQMFMQCSPFGNDSGQFRFGGFPNRAPLRFPNQFEQQQRPPFFCNERYRNSYGYQPDSKSSVDEMHRYRHDNAGFEIPGAMDSGNYRYSNGARPKSYKYLNGKKNHFKTRKNRNNSSNLHSNLGSQNEKPKDSNSGNFSSGSYDERLSSESAKEEAIPSLVAESVPLHVCEVSVNGDTERHEEMIKDVEEQVVEGAVGGVGSRLCDEVENAPGFVDKNLIDEGAICDLDNMFQNQEFSRINGERFDESDNESRENGVSGILSDDEDSELENCVYVLKSDRRTCQKTDSLPGSEDTVLNSSLRSYRDDWYRTPPFHNVEQQNGQNGVHQSNVNEGVDRNCENSEDGEDTGDFIDTDLPSHQKHILSSSDEMDNVSSDNVSDSEEEKTNLLSNIHSNGKNVLSDFNCNDLSSSESKVQTELNAFHIGTSNGEGSLSSHNSDSINHVAQLASGASTKMLPDTDQHFPEQELVYDSSKYYSSNDSFSESENGDDLSPMEDPTSVGYCSELVRRCQTSLDICSDGAAASQVPEGGQLLFERPFVPSCPPGAACELPPSSSSQCFHSNVFCSHTKGDRNLSTTSAKWNQGHEHAALMASSALDHNHQQQHPAHSDSASCSSSVADGGTCCPHASSPQLVVNNLNVCCHHSHSHVANGFSDDGPWANFSNDESNRHQKVFVKFPIEDKIDEYRESHSASSCELEDIDGLGLSGRTKDKSNGSGGSEDPLCPDSDSVDMVLLPMEEEIEPVHHMGALCAGGVGVGDQDEDVLGSAQLAVSSNPRDGGLATHMCEDHQHLYAHDQAHLGNGMPSKEFYDLIKTVSTTDSYMRFFDKDGLDVQRQPFVPVEDEASKQSSNSGSNASKTERLKVDRVMIWNEYEAYVMQFKQIAVSACGQTAVLNVLKALKISCEKAEVCKVIRTSMRKEDACIPEYLFSRACAGTTAEELMNGVEKLSKGAVGGRFFHFWPPRKVKLLQWLAYWMKRGAIPMATLNLQQGPHSLWQVPDSWHHQMVYGVGHQGLYLTNPLEIVSERSTMKQLCSDSVLMVRRQDVFSRFRETTDLGELLNHPDPRWRTMNVLGQVVNVLREFNMPSVPGYRLQVTSHISIPALYKAGITLFMRKDKSAWNNLLRAPDIPLEQ